MDPDDLQKLLSVIEDIRDRAMAVNDRHNGATDDRRNGATEKWSKRRLGHPFQLGFFTSFRGLFFLLFDTLFLVFLARWGER